MRSSRSVPASCEPGGSVIESTRRTSTAGWPVDAGWPIAVTMSGAGRRSSARRRLPVEWPARSSRTSMRRARITASSASSSRCDTSTHSVMRSLNMFVIASLGCDGDDAKATSCMSAGMCRVGASKKNATECVRRSGERMPMRSGRSGLRSKCLTGAGGVKQCP